MSRRLSEAQLWLVDYLKELGFPVVTEHCFAPPRKWRFDVAIPMCMKAFEIEGGIFMQGRHTRGAGAEKDMLKYNTAAALGWQVYRFTPRQILKGEAKLFVERNLL